MSCVRSWGSIFLSFGSAASPASKKRSRPAGYNRTRTRALNLRGTTLLRCALADAAFSRQKTGLCAVTGASRRRLIVHLRGSKTIFGTARPARFHPSGFLSGADGAYSSLHGQFDTIFSVASIIRKKCGFVNKKMQNRAVQCVCCPHFGARATSAAALSLRRRNPCS